jgi:hypothetical protein
MLNPNLTKGDLAGVSAVSRGDLMNDLLALGIFGPRWPRPLEDCQVHRGHADGVRQLVGGLKASLSA